MSGTLVSPPLSLRGIAGVKTYSIRPNPKVRAVNDPIAQVQSLTTTVKELRAGMESLGGWRGDVLDRAVTFRDLVALGLVVTGSATGGTDSGGGTGGGSTDPKIYRIHGFVPDQAYVGLVMLRTEVRDTVVFPAGGTLSSATADVAGTGTFELQAALGADAPNVFTPVAEFSYLASDVATFSWAAALVANAGDVLRVVCTSAGGTPANVSFCLAGTRP